MLLTDVPPCAWTTGRRRSASSREMRLDEAEEHLAAGQFPEGSMGPKVRAAVRFLREGGAVAAITTPPR